MGHRHPRFASGVTYGNGARHTLAPCMRASAEINLGRRSILEYLLPPVQKGVSRSGAGALMNSFFGWRRRAMRRRESDAHRGSGRYRNANRFRILAGEDEDRVEDRTPIEAASFS